MKINTVFLVLSSEHAIGAGTVWSGGWFCSADGCCWWNKGTNRGDGAVKSNVCIVAQFNTVTKALVASKFYIFSNNIIIIQKTSSPDTQLLCNEVDDFAHLTKEPLPVLRRQLVSSQGATFSLATPAEVLIRRIFCTNPGSFMSGPMFAIL